MALTTGNTRGTPDRHIVGSATPADSPPQMSGTIGAAFIDGSTLREATRPGGSTARINGQGSGFPGLADEGYSGLPVMDNPAVPIRNT
jgi:hypothetical protein